MAADAFEYNQIAYLHLAKLQPSQSVFRDLQTSIIETLCSVYRGLIITASHGDLAAVPLLKSRGTDLISSRQSFIANPDLMARIPPIFP